MRVLHVFPLFGADLTNGSELYEFRLTDALAGLGVEIDVFTTQARTVRPTSAFTMTWGADDTRRDERLGAVRVRRFPARLTLPAALGVPLSRLMLRRWRKEEQRYGTMLRGSRNLVDYYRRRALSRPAPYDWLALARGPHSPSLLAALVRTMRQYDVVLAGFVPFATVWQVTRVAAWRRTPVVLLPLFHPDDVYHHFRIFYRCLAHADGVLAQTPYSAALFRQLAPGANPVEIGGGVDEREFGDPRISGQRFRAKYALGDRRLVLFVGRKEHHKRYDLAIDAVERLADDRVRLVMIGADVDRVPITSRRVLYLGAVSRAELLDAYDACDVFVLPSEHESFGIVFLEAWMRRKPVIGNAACRPVASVIADGTDGFVCWDAAALALRIRQLLDHPEGAAAMGNNGYAKTVGTYTWTAMAKRVYNLYALLAERAAAVRSPRQEAGADRGTVVHHPQ